MDSRSARRAVPKNVDESVRERAGAEKILRGRIRLQRCVLSGFPARFSGIPLNSRDHVPGSGKNSRFRAQIGIFRPNARILEISGFRFQKLLKSAPGLQVLGGHGPRRVEAPKNGKL